MEWILYFDIAVAFFAIFAVLAIVAGTGRKKGIVSIDPTKLLFVGVITSAIFLFIPIYKQTLAGSYCGPIETFFISVHNMIRLFVVDGEFEFITENIPSDPAWLTKHYTIFFSFLFVVAPILTFGFVLSFFKSFSAYRRYAFNYRNDTYVFSDLNENSLALATSISEKSAKRFIVFTNVYDDDNAEKELIEKAERINAVCFPKDIMSINFGMHSKNSKLYFFEISDDEDRNVSEAFNIIEKYKSRKNTNLYVFSTKSDTELLLTNMFENTEKYQDGKPFLIRTRRVNHVRSLINRTVFESGYQSIFESAIADENGIKHINAVVVGMGQHGIEMTKAISWLCQMDGYEARVNTFDIDPAAEQKFKAICPELMSERFNGRFDIDGETRYSIRIHSGVDVKTKSFEDIISKLPKTTYVFVATGNDELNITTAVRIRAALLRAGCEPVIQTIVYNTEKKEALKGVANFKHQEYKIDFIGDITSSYSEAVVLNSEVENQALARHMKWDGARESDFWQYEYNYKSSIASAIHKIMKEKCNIAGIAKDKSERTEEELWAIRRLEHRRWNAYMRSEGYVYADKRNDLAKVHHLLVPFDDLPLSEQIKDDD